MTLQYQQEPIRKRAAPWLGIGAGLAALSLFAVLTTRDYSEKQALFRTSQSLRKLRKQAAESDAKVRTEVREVLFADTVKLDCVMTSPAVVKPGSAVVLLPADVGETSQELSLVQHHLAELGVKSIAFHRADAVSKPRKPFASQSLLSRIAALNAVLLGCNIEEPVVIMTTGADVWPAVCLAGMRPSDIKAIIAVQPEMFHRSRDTSWVTAVTEASKKPHNPAELEELMRPPKVDDGTLGTAITQLPRAAKALESTQRIGSMLKMTPPKVADTGDAYYQQKMATEPVLSSMEIDLLKLYAPHVTCPVISLMPHTAALPEGFTLSRAHATQVSMLNAGLLVGGVMTQEYWEKRDRTPDAAREQANASRPQGNDAISKFVSGLSGLPAVIKQRVFGTQTDQWEVVLATACQSTPPNFFPVFVTGNDLVVLPLQAPKAVARVLDVVTREASISKPSKPITIDSNGDTVQP